MEVEIWAQVYGNIVISCSIFYMGTECYYGVVYSMKRRKITMENVTLLVWFVACLILPVFLFKRFKASEVDIKAKYTKYMKYDIVMIIVSFIITGVLMLPTNDITNIKTEVKTEQVVKTEEKQMDTSDEQVVEEDNIEYDNLQKLFIGLNENTTEQQFIEVMKATGLPYSYNEQKTTGQEEISYKIAFKEGVTPFKYATESGDYMEIQFDRRKGHENKLMYATYFCHDTFRTAMFYVYGTYFDMMDKEPGENIGYYSYASGDRKGGITITYSNGNTSETGYVPRVSAEAAVNDAIVKRDNK